MSIEVTQLVKQYGAQRAVNEVSFHVSSGEVVGFLGPNGAGKSSVMKMLTGAALPTSGHINVAGFDMLQMKEVGQTHIGYLPEHNPVYPEMGVQEYLGFVAEMRGVGPDAIARVIEQTGLAPELHKKIGALSKGYRQRVGLAQALIHDPQVLILDEPTTGLDPNQLSEIRALIVALGQEKTVLLSTHIMQEVEAMCDRVLIMKSGCIVEDLSMEALKQGQDQTIRVSFDYRIEDVFLKRIPHVKTVHNIFDNEWSISFDTQEDQRAMLFDFAQENGLKIIELRKENKGLESIFRELTQ